MYSLSGCFIEVSQLVWVLSLAVSARGHRDAAPGSSPAGAGRRDSSAQTHYEAPNTEIPEELKCLDQGNEIRER